MFDLFSEVFNYLPLACCLGEKVLVVHGGLFSEDGVKLEDIKKIDRNRQPPDQGEKHCYPVIAVVQDMQRVPLVHQV